MIPDRTLDPVLSEQKVAEWLDTSRPTLQRQRSDGTGPPFIQLSERRIGYRKSAVEQWLEARTVNRVGGLPSTATATSRLAAQSHQKSTCLVKPVDQSSDQEKSNGQHHRQHRYSSKSNGGNYDGQ